jgi:hypothetical protein
MSKWNAPPVIVQAFHELMASKPNRNAPPPADRTPTGPTVAEVLEQLLAWHHLRALLLEIGRVEPIRGYDESYLSIRTPDVLARIQGGDAWEQMVPAAVAQIIKAENLFGARAA